MMLARGLTVDLSTHRYDHCNPLSIYSTSRKRDTRALSPVHVVQILTASFDT